jgi:uncharacterized protein YodC (DUF2158 family)
VKCERQAEIKVGDTVRLNSGGPEMRIVSVTEMVTAEWVNGKGEASRCSLPVACVSRGA